MQETEKEPDFGYYHHRLFSTPPSDSCSVISSTYGAKNRISLVNSRIEYKPPSAINGTGLSRNSSISKQSMIKVGTQNRFLQVPKQSLQKPPIAHTSSAVRFFIDNENNNDVTKNVETPS